MLPLLSTLDTRPDLSCYLACDRESHSHIKPMKITKPYATCASAPSTPWALHTTLKDVLGRLGLVLFIKYFAEYSQCFPSYSTMPRASLMQGRIKPGQATTSQGYYLPPPQKKILYNIEDISIYDMMTESKELKTPCGTSCMCCACTNPWLFYTEMLIIIIVLEHLYLPKRLPCTCSPAMEREQWERTQAAAGKGGKIVASLEKLHQLFFKQIFYWFQCGEKQAQLLHCFLAHGREQTCEGHFSSTALWKAETKRWIPRSWHFVWLSRHRSCCVKTFFPSLWRERVEWHCSISWEPAQLPCSSKKSRRRFQREPGQAANMHFFVRPSNPCQSTWGFFLIKAKNSQGNKDLNYSSVVA